MEQTISQADPNKSTRLIYVDYAKALTIFLVILGHTNDPYIPNVERLYMDFCYAFHMPLFFMLSGFFLHTRASATKQTLLECLKKDFMALMLPFFLWGCIYMKFSYYNLLQLAYGSWLKLRSIQTLTSLWFLPVLFLSKNYCNLILTCARRMKINVRVIGWIAVPLLFLIGFMLPHHNSLDGTNIGNFWNYDVAFVAAGFVMSGALLRPLFDKLAQCKFWHSLIGCIIFSTIFYLGFTMERPLLTAGVDNTMVMCNATYGPISFCLVNAFSGSFALILLSIVISRFSPKNTTLLFIGANTMGIYLIHKHIIYAMKDLAVFYKIAPTNLWNALGFTIPALLLSLLVVFLILRFAPIPFGKKIADDKRKTIREMFDLVFATEDSSQLS